MIKKWKFPRVFEDFLVRSENLQLWVQIFIFFHLQLHFFVIFLCFWWFSIVFHCFSWFSWISGATGKENEKKMIKKWSLKWKKNEVWNEKKWCLKWKKMKFGETTNEKKMKKEKMKNKWKQKNDWKTKWKKMKLQMKTQMKNKWKKNNFKHFQSVARCESYKIGGIQKVLVISSKRSVRDSLPITRNLPRAPKFFPCLPLKVSSAKELSDQPVQQRFCFTFFHGFFLCSHWFIFVHPFHHYPLNVYNRLCSRLFYASLGFFSGKW